MHQGKYVFAQIMDMVRRYDFIRCVERYGGDVGMKSFSCFEQFLAMSFGQLACRESLRDVAVCLVAHKEKLYHLGFRSMLVRTTLAHANESRDWRIYRDYAQVLMQEARKAYATDVPFLTELQGSVYAIDSTTIELCLNLFPWARVWKERAAMKLHLGLNLNGNIPGFFHLSRGEVSDVSYLDSLEFEFLATYIMDRGYVDFSRLFRIHEAKAFFVTRLKKNIRIKRLSSNPIQKETGIRCDQVIRLSSRDGEKKYPEKLRRIKYVDEETRQSYVFLTNNFVLPATTIASLYKYRWQV